MYVPTLAVMPRIIERSNLLATVPTRLANTFAEQRSLQVLPLPFETPALPVRTIWHERMHDNNAHRWLRGMVQEIGRDL
jgi:DNA-binding transcriptional LysR family regulator